MQNILNRKNLFTTNSLILVIIIIAILVVINLIAANHFYRLDLTAEKQFSISEATKTTLTKINDPLYIKVYFSEKLPPDLNSLNQYVKDVLAEYRSYSQNIRVEFIDPAKDPKIEAQMQALGIPALEMQVLEKDNFKVQKGYLGLAILYQDKKEVLPIIQNTASLEYDLTSAIKRLTADSLKTIAFTSGHDEHGIIELPNGMSSAAGTNDYTAVKKALDKNYNVTTLETTNEEAIKDISTLIIAGPKKEFTEKELYQIDQFIMRGGKVIFLADEVAVSQNLQVETNKTGLEDLIAGYGIKINPDLVFDANNETVPFSSGYVQFLLPYPLWPKLTQDNFDKNNPIMSKLQSISLAWASSLTTENKDSIELTTLASSSKNSGTMIEPFNLDPQQNFDYSKGAKLPMIVLAKGQFNSFFTGKKFAELKGSKEGDANEKAISTNNPETISKALEESRILVIGDSDFISDQYLNRFPDNLTFFLNTVDYLTLDSDLISIRSKDIKARPLKETSDSAKTWIKVINIIIVPIIVIIIGLVRFYLRKKIVVISNR